MLPPKDDFKIYSGRRIYIRDKKGHASRIPYVTVNGRPIKNFGTDTRNPEEQHVIEWGYWGEGASTLAQAILADFFEETYPERGYASSRDYNAPLYATLFKKAFIGSLPNHADDEMEDDSWQITSDQIRRWFATLEERGITRETLLKDLYGADYYNRS